MNNKTVAIVVFAILLACRCHPTEFGPPREIQVVSSDKEFRIRVIPPRFKRAESYQYFQRQDFASLIVAEGEAVASNAAVQLVLWRRGQDGQYFKIWNRPALTIIIPTSAHVFTVNNEPAVIIEGHYMTVDLPQIPFSIYSLSGKCVTNGTFEAQREFPIYDNSKTNWIVDGTSICLIARDGELVKKIAIGY